MLTQEMTAWVTCFVWSGYMFRLDLKYPMTVYILNHELSSLKIRTTSCGGKLRSIHNNVLYSIPNWWNMVKLDISDTYIVFYHKHEHKLVYTQREKIYLKFITLYMYLIKVKSKKINKSLLPVVLSFVFCRLLPAARRRSVL